MLDFYGLITLEIYCMSVITLYIIVMKLLGGIAGSDYAYCGICYRSVVCPSVCVPYVTLMHPAKAVGRNEKPLGRDSHVWSHQVTLYWAGTPAPHRKERFGVETPSSQRCRLSPNYSGPSSSSSLFVLVVTLYFYSHF